MASFGSSWKLNPRHRFEGRGKMRLEREDSPQAMCYKAGYGSCPLETLERVRAGNSYIAHQRKREPGCLYPNFPGALPLASSPWRHEFRLHFLLGRWARESPRAKRDKCWLWETGYSLCPTVQMCPLAIPHGPEAAMLKDRAPALYPVWTYCLVFCSVTSVFPLPR